MASYGELRNDILNEMVDQDISASVDRFIRQATQRINRDVRVSDMERRARAFGNDSRYLALPASFLEMRRLFNIVNDSRRNSMRQVAPQALRVPKPDGSEFPGYFCVHRDEIEFDYAVPSDQEVEMNYIAKYAEFTDDADTNWILDNHYDLYLFASLHEGWHHVQDNEMSAAALAKYRGALVELKNSEKRRQYMQPMMAVPNQNVV